MKQNLKIKEIKTVKSSNGELTSGIVFGDSTDYEIKSFVLMPFLNKDHTCEGMRLTVNFVELESKKTKSITFEMDSIGYISEIDSVLLEIVK